MDGNFQSGFRGRLILQTWWTKTSLLKINLNDEVREMLSQYSDYMRKEGVSYQDMFRTIKNTLISSAR